MEPLRDPRGAARLWRAVKRDGWVVLIPVVAGALSATSFCSVVPAGTSHAVAMQHCHSWAGSATRPLGAAIGAPVLVQLFGAAWGLLVAVVILTVRVSKRRKAGL
jgi:hypothetical protein